MDRFHAEFKHNMDGTDQKAINQLCLQICDIMKMYKDCEDGPAKLKEMYPELLDDDNQHIGNSEKAEQTMSVIGPYAHIVNGMDFVKQEFVLDWIVWGCNEIKRLDREKQGVRQVPKPTFPF